MTNENCSLEISVKGLNHEEVLTLLEGSFVPIYDSKEEKDIFEKDGRVIYYKAEGIFSDSYPRDSLGYLVFRIHLEEEGKRC